MEIPPPARLLDMVRRLAPGRPLVERLTEQANVYVVGGAVRDLLLGQTPTDLDLAVEGDGDTLVSSLGGQVVRHERFGTWTVAVDGFSYDVAQTRKESYSEPGALPDVVPAPLSEDLLRRDFTVNTIALALGGPQAGALSAAPQAIDDLDRGWLRVLHEGSFRDDPTRLLRLVRYASRLDFAPEEHTAELAAAAVENQALQTVSGPRIGAELRLLATEPEPLRAVSALGQFGLAQAIHPRLGLDREGVEVARRALGLLPAGARRDRLVLGLAARRIPARELYTLLDRLAFEAEDRDVIVATATRADDVAGALARAQRPSQLAAAVSGLAVDVVAVAGALGAEEAARDWLERLRHVSLEITGSDLIEAGVQQGPAIGRGLEAALAAKLNGAIAGREEELAIALETARATG